MEKNLDDEDQDQEHGNDERHGPSEMNSQHEWLIQHTGTTTIRLSFDGRASLLQCEELIDYWIDLTKLETGKRGLALASRMIGYAAVRKSVD